VITTSSSASAILAAIVGLIVFLAARWRGGPVIRLLAGAMALWLIAAPLVLGAGASGAWEARVVPKLEPADVHRLLIWEFTIDRITERPLLGWGLDSARRIPGGKQNLNDAIRDRFDGAEYGYLRRVFANGVFEALPLHPHSLALQIWLELGAAGALLAAAFIWFALGAAAAAPSRYYRASLAGTAAAGFVIANLSYGAWQSWWVAALILAIAINCALVRGPAVPTSGE
jgi:O-antigen ligase